MIRFQLARKESVYLFKFLGKFKISKSFLIKSKNFQISISDCLLFLENFYFSAEIHVNVADVNEYIPEWTEQEYSGQIEEGEPGPEPILTVTAIDRDCSSAFGSVCQYTITSPDQPFRVDQNGNIISIAPLSTQESRSHVISVVATDCGGKESSPVLVTVTVLPKCHTAWTGDVFS